MFPSPPPDAATFDTDPRIALCASFLPTPETETERDRRFKAMHPMGATLSQECVTMMGEAMCTPLFHNQFRVPTYEDWVDHDADWSHVYDVPPQAAAAPAMAQPSRPLGPEDRRAHVGARAPAAHVSRRADRLHPPRSGEVGDVVREPDDAGAGDGQRRGRPARGRRRTGPRGSKRVLDHVMSRAQHGLVPGRDVLRHALLRLRRRPVRGGQRHLRRARSAR